MALPVIDVPTFELKIPGIKEKIKFRPFLVKENKILTLATASEVIEDMYSACCQVIENCSFGQLNSKDLAMYQIQWIFLQLRSKSIGNEQSFILSCGKCNNQINYEMDITEFEIVGDQEHSETKIELSDTIGIVLKYPSAEVQMKESELNDVEILLNSISYIYQDEEIIYPEDETVEEMLEFVDNLPVDVVNKAAEFFKNIPALLHKVEYDCTECGTKNQIMINGYDHFFA
jgi:hypothetical protein